MWYSVHRSFDGGLTWIPVQLTGATNIVQTGGAQGVLAAMASNGLIYISRDRGATWASAPRPSNTGLGYGLTADDQFAYYLYDQTPLYRRPLTDFVLTATAAVPVGPSIQSLGGLMATFKTNTAATALTVTPLLGNTPDAGNVQSPLVAVSPTRSYSISYPTTGTFSADISFPYDPSFDRITDPSTLRIARKEGSGAWTMWADFALDAATRTITAKNVTGFSEWALATVSPANPLPVAADPAAPRAFALLSAAPNPFNPTTAIRYQLSAVSQVKLEAFDALGRRVRTLVDETKAAGSHTATFDAAELPSGVYLVRLTAAGQSRAMRVLLAR